MALAALVLAFPGGALAAVPANDDLADREVLGPGLPGGLPIEVTRSNEEATKESGESISVFGAGHSVWFEWEATETDWVTIGSCNSDFANLLGVFTLSEGGLLSRAVQGNPSEGPHCPYREAEYTFKAEAGTKYVIGADGNAFPGPVTVPVDTEGEVRLRIEATPPPANDDFADAADLTATGQITDLEGDELFYFARLESYNWGASKESGEPDHQKPGEPGRQTDPGGASAWYEWTAPGSGTMRMTMCCFGSPLVGIYTGSSVDALTPLPTESEIWPEVRAEVTAGQTYWIAVDGVFDEATGEAAQVYYSVNVMMNLPRRPPPVGPPVVLELPPSDLIAPETTISRKVLKRKPPIFIYGFGSNEPGSAFLCSLDRRPFAPCGVRRVFKKPMPGRHRLRVVAIDAAGNADPTPAVARFSFPRR
jgi:hypothetical protein